MPKRINPDRSEGLDGDKTALRIAILSGLLRSYIADSKESFLSMSNRAKEMGYSLSAGTISRIFYNETKYAQGPTIDALMAVMGYRQAIVRTEVVVYGEISPEPNWPMKRPLGKIARRRQKLEERRRIRAKKIRNRS